MKHLLLTILLLCAVNLNLSAQYDPCGELRVAMLTADRLVVEGKLDEALTKLNKFKNDPEMQNCPEMKNGVLDYKIQEVKKKIAERDGPKLPSYKQCPDGNHPHLIDLGLPSGTKWACCNVDAKKPEEYGGYYAWGETTTKNEYSWDTYKFCNGSANTCHDLGSNICGTQYDVAHVKWGGSWQLPTLDQLMELVDNCRSEWTTVNGVIGRSFIGFNGASIFLPAGGNSGETGKELVGSLGNYDSGTLSSTSVAEKRGFGFKKGTKDWYYYGVRSKGGNVRPVSK